MLFRSPRRSSTTLRTNFPPPYMSSGRITPPTFPNPPVTFAPTNPGLQPYLGIRARTSLAWLAYPILILGLILIQLILTLQSVQDGVGDAKREMAAACSGIEGAASVAVSIPHFMADQTNDFLVSGAEHIVHGLALVLDLSIRAIEAIIMYVIDTYRSLYLCLAEFVVRGSLALLIAVAEEAEKAFTDAVHGLRTAIQSTIGAAESVFSGAIDDLNKLPLVHITKPDLEVPSLDALQNFKMPTGLSDGLSKLNASLPTLADLRDSLDKLVTTPFEALRVEVTSKLSNATIDRSLLQVPPMKKVEFCQEMDTSFIDVIGKIISEGIKILIIAILSVIVLITLFNIVKERFLWGRMIASLHRSREVWLSNSENNLSTSKLLSFLQSMKIPLLSRVTNKMCQKNKNGRHRTPWLLAYLTWPAALMFLGAGLLGTIFVEIQLASLHNVRNHAVQEANAGVNGLTNILTDKINQETANMSATFANDTNAVILHFQSDVNDHMLGWAGSTTTTLNNTLITFYDGLTKVVQDTFGNTPLRDPALELLQCLIGSKVAGIEAALTFVHDHAHVDLPTISPTALMIKPRQTQDLVNSMASSNPDGSPDPSGANQTMATTFVDRLIDRYTKALLKQRITYFALLACYLLVIIFGVIGVTWDFLQEKRAPKNTEKTLVALDEKNPKGDATDGPLKSAKATNDYLRYPPPPPPPPANFPISSHPLPPPPPSFLEMNDEPPEPPFSKFSPITPASSPTARWPRPGHRSKN
ncbi:plasma membrane fusion protein prm1 [Puccinia graminis f. sp. tritici]|uniref:Plasma membrane fusion protein PRM1 n=2 Tax=Puccinia graminis f. sp. tritici TaxID=56615 RepID=A0A5B0PC11_PUCGR|nr:plasma membrane fusion protein prm1 [Puccinia graminis f. sp. tritici]